MLKLAVFLFAFGVGLGARPTCYPGPTDRCKPCGTCKLVKYILKCVCEPGFTGTYCNIGPCHANPPPCINGGTCIIKDCVKKCKCQYGFTGRHCEIPVHCYKNEDCGKCGHCVNYKCKCIGAFSGKLCDKGPCDSSPCLNGGTCNILPKPHCVKKCKCRYGFTGLHCEIPVHCYKDDDCGKCGHCVNYKCKCIGAFSGKLCDKGPCDSSPCQNGGTCMILPKPHCIKKCKCPYGYTGLHCEIPIFCYTNDDCGKCGHCVDHNCECKGQTFGNNCEKSICDKNPCLNGGTCQLKKDCFKECICPKYYKGAHCQIYDPCSHVNCTCGHCVKKPPGKFFECVCKPHWTGTFCDKLDCPSNCIKGVCYSVGGTCKVCCNVAVRKCYPTK